MLKRRVGIQDLDPRLVETLEDHALHISRANARIRELTELVDEQRKAIRWLMSRVQERV